MGESIEHGNEKAPRNGREFLEKLQSREAIVNDSSVAVVVAHPDDESIGFGAQFARFPGCLTVHVTDGAPLTPRHWEKHGFESREQYKETRSRELDTALNIAGHSGPRISFDIPDQKVAQRLVETAENLARIFIAGHIQFVLTHSYEGGHPDHDAVAFAVHIAKRIMQKEGLDLNIIEAPFYRVEQGVLLDQSFVPVKNDETFSLPLNEAEQVIKRGLFSAHASQKESFAHMSTTQEFLREAPAYDFTRLPNNGNLSKIFTSADISIEKWMQLTQHALDALGFLDSKK